MAAIEGEDQPDSFEAGKIAKRFAGKPVDENDPRLRRITGGGALHDAGLVRCIDALAIGRCDEGDRRAQQRMHHRRIRLPRHFLSACLRITFAKRVRSGASPRQASEDHSGRDSMALIEGNQGASCPIAPAFGTTGRPLAMGISRTAQGELNTGFPILVQLPTSTA